MYKLSPVLQIAKTQLAMGVGTERQNISIAKKDEGMIVSTPGQPCQSGS